MYIYTHILYIKICMKLGKKCTYQSFTTPASKCASPLDMLKLRISLSSFPIISALTYSYTSSTLLQRSADVFPSVLQDLIGVIMKINPKNTKTMIFSMIEMDGENATLYTFSTFKFKLM